ncbi:MAG: hypothetical protein LBQ24_05050 [Candidatus Peribacteria bacterium]|nr:hypothetical protein [Candidatus Peribacteria bacterium]
MFVIGLSLVHSQAASIIAFIIFKVNCNITIIYFFLKFAKKSKVHILEVTILNLKKIIMNLQNKMLAGLALFSFFLTTTVAEIADE